jgi:hypothetical protein
VKNIIVITIALAVGLFVMEAFAKAEPPIDTKVKASIKEGFFIGYSFTRGTPPPRLRNVLEKVVDINLDEMLGKMSTEDKERLMKPFHVLTEDDKKVFNAFSSEFNRRIFFATIWIRPDQFKD